MELHELHILERHPGPVSHSHAVAGSCEGIGSKIVHAAGSACGYDQGFAPYQEELSCGQVPDCYTLEDTVFYQDGGGIAFVVAGDLGVLLKQVIQGMHLEEAGLILGEDRTVEAMSSEGPLVDAPIGTPRPGDAPVFKLHDLFRGLLHKKRHHILVGQEVASTYGVPGVKLQAVAFLGAHDGGGATLGTYRVRAHKLNPGDNGYVQLILAHPCRLDCCPKTSQPGPQDQQIMTNFHCYHSPMAVYSTSCVKT